MNTQPGMEEQFALWLVQEAPTDVPHRVLEAAFERTRDMPQDRIPVRNWIVADRRTGLLLVAVFLFATLLVGAAVAGGWLEWVIGPTRSPDSLELVEQAGVLRVAVNPAHPQTITAGGRLDGFDVDVAREIGRRLNVDVAIVPLAPPDMSRGRDQWDLGLPSTDDSAVDTSAFVVTAPYYQWRRMLLVPPGSGATSVDDVRGQPICAVSGDAGQGWLMRSAVGPSPGGSPGPPIPSSLILRPSDDECIAAMAAGEVVAVVSSTLSPSEAADRPGVRAIAGPPSEPRVAIMDRTGIDAGPLAVAVQKALDDMRRDGTLSRLSTNRFGDDLTAPVAEP